MKNIILIAFVIFYFANFACSKKTSGTPIAPVNHSPLASLTATVKSTSPFVIDFKVTATDEDNDALSYKWDFGEGTVKDGTAAESFTYSDNKVFNIKVAVTDGKSLPVNVSVSVNTTVSEVKIDGSQQFQTMEGFGGFGAKDVYWSNGPFTSDAFVNDVVNDLGISILRDEVPVNFELVNDNADPNVTDLSKFNLNTTAQDLLPFGKRVPYFQALHAAGVQKFIATVWSPPIWMKYNNALGNGTADQNAAPDYTTSPTAATNQLRIDMYDEFAEMCAAFAKIFKQQVGVDLYALSIQNEPRFSQFYQSCVYNGTAMRDLLKVVGQRFAADGLTTRLFLPEDVGWFDGADGMIQPTLTDPAARQYVSFIATHGYAFDGIAAGSADAQTWAKMYNWGAPYNKPLWMTETSGFSNDYAGAMDLAKAMYTALNYGNVSAWVFWTLSTATLDSYSLMSSSGTKSKRYYVSKNFYRYIRPGAVRIKAETGGAGILPLAFRHVADNSQTIVLINANDQSVFITLSGAGLFSQYNMYTTTAADNCADIGLVNSNKTLSLPPNSVVTLYKKN